MSSAEPRILIADKLLSGFLSLSYRGCPQWRQLPANEDLDLGNLVVFEADALRHRMRGRSTPGECSCSYSTTNSGASPKILRLTAHVCPTAGQIASSMASRSRYSPKLLTKRQSGARRDRSDSMSRLRYDR